MMIKKCAAIIIRHKRLLVVRKHKTSIYISPGGKPESDETPIECLVREIKEELGVEIQHPIHFSTDYANSALENEEIEISSWLTEIYGTPKPCSEIVDIRWIGAQEAKNLKIGSVFQEKVIPRLKSMGRIE